jgi:hypothetical protein
MAKIKKAVRYFDKQVGHFTDIQNVIKIREETMELQGAIIYKTLELEPDVANAAIVDECSDVLTVAFHIATRNGYKGTPNDLFMQAYNKMKRRIESGERDYINRDF